MIRAFAAVALPDAARIDLTRLQQGLPVARAVPPENFHVTLVFLGELPVSRLADVSVAFAAIRAPAFALTLAGGGLFGGARPRAAYAGVTASPALVHLQAKVETAARNAGVAVAARRFVPHVTLARLPSRLDNRERLERAVAGWSGYAGPRFEVEAFHLYRSHLGHGGPVYEELASYPLDRAGAPAP